MPAIDDFGDLGFDIVDLGGVDVPSLVVDIESLSVQVNPHLVTRVKHNTWVVFSLQTIQTAAYCRL